MKFQCHLWVLSYNCTNVKWYPDDTQGEKFWVEQFSGEAKGWRKNRVCMSVCAHVCLLLSVISTMITNKPKISRGVKKNRLFLAHVTVHVAASGWRAAFLHVMIQASPPFRFRAPLTLRISQSSIFIRGEKRMDKVWLLLKSLVGYASLPFTLRWE